MKTFEKYQHEGESIYTSQFIDIRGKKYVVSEYRPSINPKVEPNGFIILDSNGNLLEDRRKIQEILGIYILWRYIYFNKSFLGGSITFPEWKYIIKSSIKFQNKSKETIENWKKNNYKIFKNSDKAHLDIVKELDQQVLESYPINMEILNLQQQIFEKGYQSFVHPASELYDDLLEKMDQIVQLNIQENKILSARKLTFEKLYSYYETKIKKIPEPKSNIKKAILGDAINYFYLKELYPLGGATVVEILDVGSKKLNKESKKRANYFFNKGFGGVNTLKNAINLNNKFEHERTKLLEIRNNVTLQKVRNFEKR